MRSRQPRPAASSARVLLVFAALLASGCAAFSSKRTDYEYNPDYGVDSPEFRRSLDALGTEMVPGNQAELLENGDEIFPAMLEAIRGARLSVNIEMYLFSKGQIGEQFVEALSAKAREGVKVRLLVDSVGSRLGDLEKAMLDAGIEYREYRPLRIYSIYRLGNRTHRKIMTVDGKIGFCGGVGIDDRWMGDARNPREWREAVVRVEGPVVAQLQSIFMEDWVHTTGEVLHGDGQFPPIPRNGPLLAQAVASSRTDQSSMAKLLYYMAIQASRQRIWIENAYFVPDAQIRQGLVQAVKRGVNVKVIVPGRHIDIPVIRMASQSHYGELLDGGVEIYEYRPTMMHNKVMVVDGMWATIGSINFSNRSMRKNAEANVAIYDADFARKIEAMIENDLLSCERLNKDRWKRRGIVARMGEFFSRLFSENY